jgi:TRAP transporter TAXI family solute receptor
MTGEESGGAKGTGMEQQLRRHLAIGVFLSALSMLPPPCSAQTQSTTQIINELRERTNAGTVGVVSGGINGTYIRIAAELAAVLDKGDDLRVLPLVGKGSVQNIADVLFLKGVDIGIVQSDVLSYIKRERLYPGADKSIQYIAKLYNEEFHLLAAKDIARVEDLAGKKVNVDVQNSGTAMTATLVLERLGTRVEVVHSDQALALDKLRRGEIAALAYVAGKPANLFRDVKPEEGLHFLALPLDPSLLETYLPAQFTHADYPALVGENEPVDTVAVGAVMAVYNWAPGSPRHTKVARFVEAFFGRFQEFLEPPRHPKWREVNLAAQVPGWTRFAPAEDWLKRETMASGNNGPLRRDFEAFVNDSGAAAVSGSSSERDALFQSFLRWENDRSRTGKARSRAH